MDGSLSEAIRRHAIRYPLMQPQDAVKLVYQNEFGGGHLVEDEEKSLERLRDEYEAVRGLEAPEMYETIGNGYGRLNLSALDPREIPLERVNRVWIESARENRGTTRGFFAKLDELEQIAGQGVFRFAGKKLAEFLAEYKTRGEFMIGHSREFREAYHPAYRVVQGTAVQMWPALREVERRLAKGRAVIAVEGNSAAGKTTAAGMLGRIYDAGVVHMDDFFLPVSRRGSGWEKPGGNIDYERFREEVARPLECGEDVNYRIFNCMKGEYTGVKRVKKSSVIFIEGAYSMHPGTGIRYDAALFLKVSAAEQKRRILDRDGQAGWEAFSAQWIPREHAYFTEFGIKQKCGVTIENFGGSIREDEAF